MEWITKQKDVAGKAGEVSIVLCKSKKNGVIEQSYNFTFRNYCHQKITNTDHMIFGVQGTRLYFAKAEKKVGYKLFFPKIEKATGYIKLLCKNLPTNNGVEEGDFNLEFDFNQKLYFIDICHKLSQIDWTTKQGA